MIFSARVALRNRTKILILCVVGLLSLNFTLPVSAQVQTTHPRSAKYCSYNGSGNVTTISNISFGSVSANPATPIGSSLTNPISVSFNVLCPANRGSTSPYNTGYYLQFIPDLTVSNTVSGVWETGFPGVGIRAISSPSGEADITLSNVGVGGWSDWRSVISVNADVTFNNTFTFQLVKTGPITQNGPINIPKIVTAGSYTIPGGRFARGLDFMLTNTSITAMTCTVTTPSVNVTLPAVSASTFNAVGTTFGDQNFRIDLIACPVGPTVYVTLSDSVDSSNRTDRLTPSPSSTASGVQIRLLKSDGTPVSYGPPNAAAGATNEWLVGPGQTLNAIPLTAQYISTSRTVTPGTVQAIATFTLNYQ